MKIIRGPYRGQGAKLRQFANDWIMVDLPGAPGRIVRPGEVQINADERVIFESSTPAAVGTFWREWALNDDGTFSRIPR